MTNEEIMALESEVIKLHQRLSMVHREIKNEFSVTQSNLYGTLGVNLHVLALRATEADKMIEKMRNPEEVLFPG